MHEKRKRKGMKLSILAGLLALIMAMTAFADPVLDMGDTGEITVNMQIETDGTVKTVSGGTMAIYRVAEVYGVGGTADSEGGYFFRLTGDFKGCTGVELDGKTGDELNTKWADYAEILADYAAENSIVPDDIKDIGADGKATFSKLSNGLYLLVQTEPSEGYSSVNPFLVSLPYYEDGQYKYSVETYPKTGPVKERHYYDIDEEIVSDMDDIWDRDAWIPSESVNEYEAIEIEMTTYLPTISGYDVAHGEITMNFHEVLDPELLIDDRLEDFSVYIAGQKIPDNYYDVIVASGVRPMSLQPSRVVDSIDDGCTFHVDVDLTALYNDGIVTDDMLLGDTEITIFFYVDLETVDEKNHYASTIWYEIFDGYDEETREWLYTSSVVEVYVYTYEIDLIKYDASQLVNDDYAAAALDGATLGIYTDADCINPFLRNDEQYTATSGANGRTAFYGLAGGIYYIKEIEAPSGYELSDEILKVVIPDDLNDGYAYAGTFGNTPSLYQKSVDTDGDGYYADNGTDVNYGDNLSYRISYINTSYYPITVTITDILDEGLTFVSADNGGIYDPETHTITWIIENVEGFYAGSVTFEATVNITGRNNGEVNNTADIQFGNDPAVSTNTVTNPVNPSSSTSGGGHHSSGGGGGGGSSSGGGGSTVGGPGSGDGGSGDGDSGGSTWDLLPLPQTGQGWALTIAICAMIVAGVGLIVAYRVKRKG